MKDLHPVEILIVATMAAAWAVATLARAILRLLASAGTPPEHPEPVATITPPEPPQLAELATMRDRLMLETATTLRQITGTRQRCSKAELVNRFLAMPV